MVKNECKLNDWLKYCNENNIEPTDDKELKKYNQKLLEKTKVAVIDILGKLDTDLLKHKISKDYVAILKERLEDFISEFIEDVEVLDYFDEILEEE